MIESAYFNGEDISCDDVDSVLIEKGLSKDRIELIRMRAYQTVCCHEMDNCEAVHPVIDYGEPCVVCYEAYMPALNQYNKRYPKRVKWSHCPFCGKSTQRIIHPDCQTSIDGSY